MTPEARISTAAEILDMVLAGAPAEKALTGWARRSRFAGSKDRAAIRDHVFDALRCKRSFAAFGGALTGRGLMIGMLRAEGRDPDTVFTGQGHAPAPLSDAERAHGQRPEGNEALDLSDWVVPEFSRSLGENASRIADILRTRAPIMLRVNLRKTTRDAAINALQSDGIQAVPVAISDTALVVTEGARRINGSAAYRDGLVELQDGASQAVVDRLPLKDGARVLDYCAGGGGKTLAMAGRAQARFYAHDANEGRMKDLPERAARAGVHVSVLTGDVSGSGPFDLVLCDAPCSGSGAWRRSPEGKWSLTRESLSEVMQIQSEILDKAKDFVDTGGVLAYATCSVLSCENDAAVQGFLNRHPDWELLWSQQWLPSSDGDGFFAACLTRRAK